MQQFIERLLCLAAAILALVAVTALGTGGGRLQLGPLQISATDPARVALQASLVWLVAVLVAPWLRQRRALVMASLLAVLVTAVADSTPRRVGDGAEYVAMALNLSRARPPALSIDEKRALDARLVATPGFEDSPLDQPLVGGDGRQDFPHFWLYSLLVSPLLAVGDALGLHANHAFTVFNVTLVLLLAWALIKDQQTLGAGLLVAGPLLWWVDKAHAEVPLFVAFAAAVLFAHRRPALALIAAGLATAQNPASVVVLGTVAVFTIADPRRTRRTEVALGVAVLTAAAHPAYYLWHLGTWSPLAVHAGSELQGLKAILTPLFDPNLGLVPHAPVLVALAILGVEGASLRSRALPILVFFGLLLVLSRPLNVNHGGTPGMSRYGLWLLACLTPLIAEGARRLERQRPVLMAAGLMLTVSMTWFTFRPSAVDRGGNSPSLGAALIWSRWPALDNPLPEVFAERVTGVDGVPPVPAATSDCRKVLVRGDGSGVWWPFPCEPREAPPACTAQGALCYVNDGTYTAAPRQRGFTFDPAADRSWSLGERGRLEAIRSRLGEDVRSLRFGSARRVDGGVTLPTRFIVEGTLGTAVWVRPSDTESVLHLRVSQASDIEIQHAGTGEILTISRVEPGVHPLRLAFPDWMLVLVTDAR